MKILLIDNAYFGVGLNIEYTTDMIFFHNVEEKMKTQLVVKKEIGLNKKVKNENSNQ